MNHRKAFTICLIMVSLAWTHEDLFISLNLWELINDLFLVTSFIIIYRKLPK